VTITDSGFDIFYKKNCLVLMYFYEKKLFPTNMFLIFLLEKKTEENEKWKRKISFYFLTHPSNINQTRETIESKLLSK